MAGGRCSERTPSRAQSASTRPPRRNASLREDYLNRFEGTFSVGSRWRANTPSEGRAPGRATRRLSQRRDAIRETRERGDGREAGKRRRGEAGTTTSLEDRTKMGALGTHIVRTLLAERLNMALPAAN